MPVHFVGHPLIDAMQGLPEPDPDAFRRRHGLAPDKKIIALLPGSRRQEISKVLPMMVAATREFPDYQFAVAGAPNLGEEPYGPFLEGAGIPLLMDQTYPLLQHADAALVTGPAAWRFGWRRA